MATENDLIRAWQQTGCIKSRNSVLESHYGAIRSKAYKLPNPGGIEREELFAEGVLGMLEALDKFQTDRGIKFLSYGLTASINKMLDYIAKNGNRGISYYGKSDGIERLLGCVGYMNQNSQKDVETFSEEKGIPMSDLMAFMRSRVSDADPELNLFSKNIIKDVEKEDILRKAVTLLDTKCDKYERAAVLSQITEDYTIGQIADSVGRTRQGLRDTYKRTMGYLREKLG